MYICYSDSPENSILIYTIMKIKHLLCGLLAMAALASCKQDEPVVTPELDLNKTAATVAAEGGAVEFEVTSNVDWTADADQDWVSVDPQTGNGNAKVKATVTPNEAEDARTATITVKADKLTKTLKITQSGKKADEPVVPPTPDVTWGLMGCFVDNLWSTDVPMTQEGEWAVAKGAQFTELTFKIRGNASWDDATNIGYAPGTAKGYVNGKLSVVTAEYSKANLGGDSADIKLDGEPGTYDVYFSFENLEVYVMEEGSKPGEKDPVIPSEPKEVTYTIAGTLNGINWNNASAEGLMTKEGAYHVAKNVPFVTAATLYGGADQIEFKVCETGTWDAFGVAAGTPAQSANTEIPVQMGGDNICVAAEEGAYDVYLDAENGKVWVMAPGYQPGEAPAQPEYSIDGKQWMAEMDGMPVLFDFGLAEEGMLVVALPTMDETGFGLYMAGLYEVAATDATSGTVVFTQYDWEWDEFMEPIEIPYSDLGATTVKAVCEAMFGISEPVTFTLVENPYEIQFETSGGGASGEVANGEYWFIEPTTQKVMTPLGETYTYGRPAAADAVNGASTAANAFTLLYNPDWSCYTIQDSYGRYLYQGMMEDGDTPYRTISVSDELPAADDENLAFYMWTVYNNGDGTYDIYNCASYYSITYSPAYNNWEIYDPYESDFENLFPSLVKADNPIE